MRSGTETTHEAWVLTVYERRVGWARENLGSSEYTEMEKVWMRRYEIDVTSLLERIREAEGGN